MNPKFWGLVSIDHDLYKITFTIKHEVCTQYGSVSEFSMFKILVLLLLHISKEHTDVDLTCDFYSSWAMGFKLMDKGGSI